MLLSGVDYPLQYVASVRSKIVTIQILLVFDLYFYAVSISTDFKIIVASREIDGKA
jgi:hypothetical protein